MIGGERGGVAARSDLRDPRPGTGDVAPHARAHGRRGTAEQGYLHCGPNGAGHFVKMVHNGIEYGLMAAYAEGLNILKHANVGKRDARRPTPRRRRCASPEHYQYDFDLAEWPRCGGAVAWSPPGCWT